VQLEDDSTKARGMFLKEFRKMFGYWIFFYAMLGLGIAWRMELPRELIWRSTAASLFFGVPLGGVMLVLGAIIMRRYALRKAVYVDFGPAASLTLVWSFRIFSFIGLPLALWDIFRVIVPITGHAGETFVQGWWMWLLLVGGIAGWFSGRALGGLIGLLAIWIAGRQ